MYEMQKHNILSSTVQKNHMMGHPQLTSTVARMDQAVAAVTVSPPSFATFHHDRMLEPVPYTAPVGELATLRSNIHTLTSVMLPCVTSCRWMVQSDDLAMVVAYDYKIQQVQSSCSIMHQINAQVLVNPMVFSAILREPIEHGDNQKEIEVRCSDVSCH